MDASSFIENGGQMIKQLQNLLRIPDEDSEDSGDERFGGGSGMHTFGKSS